MTTNLRSCNMICVIETNNAINICNFTDKFTANNFSIDLFFYFLTVENVHFKKMRTLK